MLYHIISNDEEQDDDDSIQQKDIEKFKELTGLQQSTKDDGSSSRFIYKFKESDILRKKIKFVSKMMLMQKTLREQNEAVVQLKGACPDKRLPKGLLSDKSAINDGISIV